ncbi:MAG: hypothetical protein AVDCRST_MAG79-1292, partial [uncultured Thermoleophilia bacterium]
CVTASRLPTVPRPASAVASPCCPPSCSRRRSAAVGRAGTTPTRAEAPR